MRLVHSKGCLRHFKRVARMPCAFRHHEMTDILLFGGPVVGLCGMICFKKSRFDRLSFANEY